MSYSQLYWWWIINNLLCGMSWK